MRQRKVQGFCGKTAKILALEQRIIALKALACKGFCVVQYTLFQKNCGDYAGSEQQQCARIEQETIALLLRMGALRQEVRLP